MGILGIGFVDCIVDFVLFGCFMSWGRVSLYGDLIGGRGENSWLWLFCL